MDDAWVTYDDIGGTPLSVVWEKPQTPCVAIPKDLAIQFLEGTLNLSNHIVAREDDIVTLVQVEQHATTPPMIFWTLRSLDDVDSVIDMSIMNDHIVVQLHDISHTMTIFATLKNDPSWLIHVWNLKDHPMKDGNMSIQCDNATEFSYYVSRHYAT